MIPNVLQSPIVEILDSHRALAILRLLLSEELNGAANEELLSDLLDAWALGCSHARLRASLRFLEQSGLVTTTTAAGELTIAHLTREGSEVAEGRVRAQGVLPFRVGCPY